MMLAMLLALAQAVPLAPPADWTQLPTLRWKTPPSNVEGASRFVRAEVAAGRCAAAQRAGASMTLHVDVAVLATAAGRVRAVMPLAINCPTVEQYTVGLVQRMALDNVDTSGQAADTWYHTGMTYSWSA